MLDNKLVHKVIEQFSLKINGIHGITHWARVLENGRLLAPLTGAKLDVVELFAVFHDAKRIKEWRDDEHGQRGAEYAKFLRGEFFTLPNEDFKLLYTACADHTAGLTAGDITIQTCWDADRLDLGRVFKTPHPEYLCTTAAKSASTIRWASARAMRHSIPPLIMNEWNYSNIQRRSRILSLWRRIHSLHQFLIKILTKEKEPYSKIKA